VGALASAILVANNLRDRPGDAATAKNTLAVRLGDARTRRLWIVLVAVSLLAAAGCALWRPWSLLALASAGLALGPLRTLRSGATGPALIPVLAGTGKLQLGYAVLLAAGLALG